MEIRSLSYFRTSISDPNVDKCRLLHDLIVQSEQLLILALNIVGQPVKRGSKIVHGGVERIVNWMQNVYELLEVYQAIDEFKLPIPEEGASVEQIDAAIKTTEEHIRKSDENIARADELIDVLPGLMKLKMQMVKIAPELDDYSSMLEASRSKHRRLRIRRFLLRVSIVLVQFLLAVIMEFIFSSLLEFFLQLVLPIHSRIIVIAIVFLIELVLVNPLQESISEKWCISLFDEAFSDLEATLENLLAIYKNLIGLVP